MSHLGNHSQPAGRGAAEGRDVPVTPLCLRPLSLVAAPAASPSVRLAEEETSPVQHVLASLCLAGSFPVLRATELTGSHSQEAGG